MYTGRHKILHISYKKHVTKDEVQATIQKVIEPHKDLIMRRHNCSEALIFAIHHVWPKRHPKKQRKEGEDKADKGSGLKTTSGSLTGLQFGKCQRAAENRGSWRKMAAKSFVVPQ